MFATAHFLWVFILDFALNLLELMGFFGMVINLFLIELLINLTNAVFIAI